MYDPMNRVQLPRDWAAFFNNGEDVVRYLVVGHQPRGHTPTVTHFELPENGQALTVVCADTSRAGDPANFLAASVDLPPRPPDPLPRLHAALTIRSRVPAGPSHTPLDISFNTGLFFSPVFAFFFSFRQI